MADHTINQGAKKTPYKFYNYPSSDKVGEGACPGLSNSMHMLRRGVNQSEIMDAIYQSAHTGQNILAAANQKMWIVPQRE